tara:strand:- start:989 stop:1858 length:870 start_codon:yes stop_codon:yes gene_type:complete
MSFLNTLINNQGTVQIKRFDGSTLPKAPTNYQKDNNFTKVCFLDLETTGLNKNEDKIIELAVKIAAIDNKSKQLLGILDEYQGLQDPKELIDEKITQINGITNEMVKNQEIDWDTVQRILEKSDLIVAHNAGFDRIFMDRYLSLSKEKIWACSVNDIDWNSRGFKSKGQELLCIWHGYYFESHRAMSDVDALIHLVTHDSYADNPPINDLIKNAYKPTYKICAINSSFEKKDALKANGYFWNSEERYWWKNISLDDAENEKIWLADNVYEDVFKGTFSELPIVDKYKNV